MKHPISAALLAASAAFALSGCATDYGYGGSSISLGYNSGYYGGSPYYGWYDDFYYPGTGYYIYDRGGRRHRWNDGQRRYWEGRRGNRPGRDNWSGYRSGGNAGDANWGRRQNWRSRQSGQQSAQPQATGDAAVPSREERQQAWRAQRQQQQEASGQSREQRMEAWRAQRQQQGTSGGWRGRSEGRRNRGN